MQQPSSLRNQVTQIRSRLVSQVGLGQLYCAQDAVQVPHVEVDGQSAWVSDLALRHLVHSGEVGPLLPRNATPALVLRGECDLVPLQETRTYAATLQNSHLVYASGAGHSLWATRADQVRSVISEFLLNHPLSDDHP